LAGINGMKPTEAISFGFKVEFLSIIASVMAAKKEIAIEAEGFIEANSFLPKRTIETES